ncbi:MAG: CAAX geranylgeranyltransferase alpha subunit [Alectoria sarmentosa]|nr:MAG: CAAX geranylgeranyltransferase alpha subunit [Alectoria sarmentosa]
MGKYSDSDEWEDIVPIPQDDGGLNPLAAIAYTEEYSEAMSYLRAAMAEDEKSDRALSLTEDIIRMNPAHYTVWLYRADMLFTLQKDLLQELEWLTAISLKHIKNFQIWHHRQVVMSHIPTLPPTETAFLARMFAKDAKNYHVWSYRQWLVRHFSLWDSELPYVETLLQYDVRNNSAWNHRWFIVFARYTDPKQHSIKKGDANSEIPLEIMRREIEYTKTGISTAPQNQSPWNYLRGVLKNKGMGLVELKGFAEQYADLEKEDEVRSSHALDFLADVYAEEEHKERSAKALELLARRYDPIRKNYWDYRRSLLGLEQVGA